MADMSDEDTKFKEALEEGLLKNLGINMPQRRQIKQATEAGKTEGETAQLLGISVQALRQEKRQIEDEKTFSEFIVSPDLPTIEQQRDIKYFNKVFREWCAKHGKRPPLDALDEESN
jgi:hypothetical protein